MKKCDYCGRESEHDVEFCSGCGSRFTRPSLPISENESRETLALKAHLIAGRVAKTTEKSLPRKIAKPGACSYCGQQNDPEAQFCSGCGSPLTRTDRVTAQKSAELQNSDSPISEAITSDNPWTAKDAWKCLGMFFVFNLVVWQVFKAVGILFPSFRHFGGTGAGHLFFSITHYALQIATVLYFARIATLQTFLKAFGLAKPLSSYAWFAVAVTLIIRLVGHWIIASGLSRGSNVTSLLGFTQSSGIERILYLAPLLLAPFAEELYMRGFFYRAFRGSYTVLASTLLILGITALTHADQYYRSWISFVAISSVTNLQCFLRERTGNLRDCMLSHLVFNASAALFALRGH